MRKYYIFIAILSLAVLTVVVVGFTIVGSPVSQKDLQLDRNRMNHFYTINNAVKGYYMDNKSLPATLSELKSYGNFAEAVDPETKKEYVYRIVSDTTYELCTEFSLSSKDSKEEMPYYYGTDDITHDKGYDCITFKGTY